MLKMVIETKGVILLVLVGLIERELLNLSVRLANVKEERSELHSAVDVV
jgi:hypothetical protein